MIVPPADIATAARLLEQGRLVAFPTETVYGLGADAENPAAIARIYAAKGRPSNHPVIVHLAPGADLGYWASAIPFEAQALIDAFWPGPLTLILPRAAHIPAAVAGGQDSVGVRCPSHPVAQALLREFKSGKGGIAAPSANKFGHVSPTTAQHVRDEFGVGIGTGTDSAVDMVLDGGQSDVGIESSIVDLTRLATHGPVLLRPGRVTVAELAAVLGVMPGAPDAAAPRASGTLQAHYAPLTPVAMVASAELLPRLQQLLHAGRRVALMHWSDTDPQGVLFALRLPASPAGFAHALYAGLRELDAVAADLILVESPPKNAPWQAVHDRLRRAAHDSVGILEHLL
ncbi:L-threonylcarbamoyladenylate synthase [Actimicrobium antarcticum]|uniref:Threonylcarbamoyl-AMP synthase n=1 Tax=Actimicrobium antarcticum TaxID=1051899 RepID=A0ABP7TCD0_9BURK